MSPRSGYRSLATKFSVFTGTLLIWVVGSLLAFDYHQRIFNFRKGLLLCAIVFLVAGVISRFTYRVLVRPLQNLERGIESVGGGKLETLQISPTGDEIEVLGKAFNRMIEALASSQEEIRRHQESLELRIRQRTEDLEEAMQKALAASRAKSEFLANMSHELRTPMTGILGMIDLVLASRVSGENREHLEMAQRCAHSLLMLLNDLLDLSKIEAGRMGLEQIPFDLYRVVEDCAASQSPGARQKGIGLTCRIDPAVPRHVEGDPLRLCQILTNLVNNAVKFTESGSVAIRLNAAESPEPGSFTLRIDVSDTGTGIPSDKLPFIFDKFTQADGSITRRYGGSGLGLAITQRLVDMHRGRIWVESQEGQGSDFHVCVPLKLAQGAFHCVPATAPSNGNVKRCGPAKAPARILLVEDNLVNQKVVGAILRKKGYTIEIAANGEEALQKLEGGDFSLVLMDVQMPVMDGLEATRRIRKRESCRNLPILAMTAYAMVGDRERCLEAGMSAYISKPVHPAALIETIESLLAADGAGRPARRVEPVDRAAHLMDANEELMRGMIRLFLQLAPERLEKLHSAAARDDAAGLLKEAKSLKNAATRIAAQDIADCAARVEAAAQGNDPARVGEQLARLECELRRLERTLPAAQRGAAASSIHSVA